MAAEFTPPPFSVSFNDKGTVIGTLTIVDGKMHFEGDADASAKFFFDQFCAVYDAEVARMKAALGEPLPE